ncbi:MAG: hypothetical protein R3F39_06040 [Myxococcota bacterium]
MRARRWVCIAAAVALLAGCGGEDGDANGDVGPDAVAEVDAIPTLDASPDSAPDGGPDAASEVADTPDLIGDAAPEVDTAISGDSDATADGDAPTDAEIAAETQPEIDSGPDASFCTKGEVACVDGALTECVDEGQPPLLLTTCPLGCDPVLPACSKACAPGEVLPCALGVTRRCADSGQGAVAVARCLGDCAADGVSCQPLGETDLTLPTGEGDIDEVARFAADGAGDHFGVVWSRVLAPSLHLLVTDHDGNALHGPIELPSSQGMEPTQIQVVGRPGGGFGVMALESDVAAGMAKFTLWRVDAAALTSPVLVIADAHRSLPSLVALGDELAVYSVGSSAGGDILERQRFGPDGSASVMESVDSAGAERYDVAAARTGTDSAHVYAAISSGVRLSTSTLAVASGSSKSIGVDDLLIANAAGAPGLSAVLALRFPEVGPEEFVYRVEGPVGASWVKVGSADLVDWAFVAVEAGGVRVVTQDPAGALWAATGNATALGSAKPLWSPKDGSTRTDFRLVRSESLDEPRLMALGKKNPEAPAAVTIRRLVAP